MRPDPDILLLLPVVIPLLTGILTVFFWRRPEIQRILSLGGTMLLLLAAILLLLAVSDGGIHAVAVGNWAPPFGIVFVADLLSALMVLLAAITGLAVAVYALRGIDARRESFGYHTFFQILLMGVCGAFLTGDLFNLYVWFEVMLISSFVLVALGGLPSQLEGAVKYVTLNLVSSAIFLAAAGIVYGVVGTLTMADVAVRLRALDTPGLSNVLAMLFLVAFGIKAAVFPLYFWLPSSYHTPPVAVSAVFAGLLTKVGVYALIRVFTLIFTQDTGFTHTVILVVAGATMVGGVFGAMVQQDFRRILSFHIVSQIGYMLMGLGLFTPFALAGSVFYIAHHIIVKTNLFLVSGAVQRLRGTFDLAALGGVYRRMPLLSGLFLIPAFSLAGIPPLSGFWAKYALVRAGLEVGQSAIVVVALFAGLLTLYSMTKIWAEVFWKEPESDAPAPALPSRSDLAGLLFPIAALAALTMAIGVMVEPLLSLAQHAADQLANPSAYIDAVLQGRR